MIEQNYLTPKLKDGINRLRRFFLELNLATPPYVGVHACQIFRKLSLGASKSLFPILLGQPTYKIFYV